MTARNDITGDLIQTKFNSKQYRENLGKIYGDKPAQRGRFKQCPDTGKMLPLEEWYAKHGKVVNASPMVICNNFEPYQSPIDGTVIQNKRAQLNDLHKNGCRRYEGFKTEQAEADSYRKHERAKLDQKIDKTLDRTLHDISNRSN